MATSSDGPEPRSFAADLGWGVGWGAAYALILSAFVACQGVLDGGAAVASHRTTVPGVIAAYWLVGPAAGLLVGLLRPLTRTALGTAGVGALAGTLVYGGIGLAKDGWTADTPVVAVVAGVLVGVPGALMLRARRRGAHANPDANAP